MSKKFKRPDPKLNKLLVSSGSYNRAESDAALADMAEALVGPLREGVLDGDIHSDIFTPIVLSGENGTSTPEFPLHWLTPGTENEFAAFTIPKEGYIPQKSIEGDYVVVPTFPIANGIDWPLRYARDARWDIVTPAINTFRNGFTQKSNDDAWHSVLAAGTDRNIVVTDSDANTGQFTKRLVSLAKLVMRRNGGGNSTSINRRRLTDIYLSPEAMEDIRNWNVDQVDEITRREIFVGGEALTRIFQVNLHDIDELGEGQEYQSYYEDTLGGSLPSGDNEIAVGLDLSGDDMVFVNPIREELSMYPDEALHRQQRAGFYGWMEHGWAVLDNRRVLLLSL